MSSSNKVSVNYTFNQNNYTCSGNFTQNGNIYTANLADPNFPAISSVGGIIIQLTIESNNKITINEVVFCKTYKNSSLVPFPTTSPVTNVTFNVNINNQINYYNTKFSLPVEINEDSTEIDSTVLLFTYSSFPAVGKDFFFSQAALKQVATTNTQTAALLTKLDPINIFLTSDQKNQIAIESGKIAGHVSSISEGINLIGKTLAKR
jgi:hypothetical protein